MSTWVARVVWVAALLGAGACEESVACGLGPGNFDAARLQRQIAEHWAGMDRPAFTVDCGASRRPLVADARFECALRLADGQQAPIAIHVTDAAGSYTWKLSRLVDVAGIVRDITREAKSKHGLDVTLTCPHAQVGVHGKGERFMCLLKRSDGRENPVAIDVEDDDGTARWEILAGTP